LCVEISLPFSPGFSSYYYGDDDDDDDESSWLQLELTY
jgi:hypothetical protein